METSFMSFWRLYAPLKEYGNRYRACDRLWQEMDESRRQAILRGLEQECENRSPPVIHTKNPYFYLTDWEPPRKLQMTFAEYYARYHTTAEQDGWHMENPTGQQVIFTKTI